MADDVCGHPTEDDTPCQNPASHGDSCWLPSHGGDAESDGGRPTKLTKERQESIATQLEQGKSMVSAARMNGVDPATVYNWLDRGEDDENSVYAEFYERIVRAKGFGENTYFNTVWEIAREEGDHRFLASLMKQRFPESWGETDTGVDAEQTIIQVPDSVAKEWQRKSAER